jgi:hypothetical protein
MTRVVPALLSVVVLALAVASGLRAQSNAEDVDGSVDAVAVADPSHVSYEMRVAAHGDHAPVVDADLPPLCPAGSVLWHRDIATDLCTPVCTTDADCLEGLERCAVISLPEAVPQLVRVFADDDVTALERVDAEQAVALCDVFFDAEGPPSADLIEVAADDPDDQ